MKKKLLYLVYLPPILIVCYLIYNGVNMTFEKRIIGKWKLIDVQIQKQERNPPSELSPELQKKLEETKKMFLKEPNILMLQFGEDKKMTVISSKGKARPYKIINNELIDVEDAEGEISIKKAYSFTFKNELKIAITLPEKEYKMLMMFEQQN
jgi:hypothetical protein